MIYSRKIKVQLLERTVLIRLTIDRQRNYLFVGFPSPQMCMQYRDFI